MRSYWRGRRMERQQRWVSEQPASSNETITDPAANPDDGYRQWRAEYMRTGDDNALTMMLEYVT